jgi:RNA polymerase sigma-70 factor (ECF subfamily)
VLPSSADANVFLDALRQARAGSNEALGQLLMGCRQYLLLVANQKLDDGLRGKVNPSDVVQETFLEAQRDFSGFHGEREDELLAWLGRILSNNLANVTRHFRGTEMRAVQREVSLAGADSGPQPAGQLAADTPTPSKKAVVREQAAALEQALGRLPEHYRRAIQLRYDDDRSFAEIGEALGCSAEAARKLWARAIDQLQKALHPKHEP